MTTFAETQAEVYRRLLDRTARIEALLAETITALKAGAVGAWGNGPRA
jgi:hypothetical protein